MVLFYVRHDTMKGLLTLLKEFESAFSFEKII